MHWVDVIAKDLLNKGKRHTIASGTSISGQIHLGNAGDVIIADAIARAINEKGGSANIIWIMDDADALRSTPPPIPKEFDKYLGMPVSSLPCPSSCCSSFVEHFTKPFVGSLTNLGIKPEIHSDLELYKNGIYEPYIKVAIEKSRQLRGIFREVSGAEKPIDWLPFEAICESCGKIATTRAYKFDGKNIIYKCIGGIAGKKKISGCGYEGATSLRNGKLPWRIEWSARWKIFNVTCEPFGKEHSAAGGSYDTAKIITKEIYGYEPPYPVFYEHILVNGKKMSKSLGNIITTEELLECVEKPIIKYLFFRTLPTKHKDIDMKHRLLKLTEDYERAERIYYDIEKCALEKEIEDIKRGYELAQIAQPPEKFYQLEYHHLVILAQIAKDFTSLLAILDRLGTKPSKEFEQKLEERHKLALNWLLKYAPPQFKFEIQKTLPLVELSSSQKEFLRKFAEEIEIIEWQPVQLHSKTHEVSKELGIDAKESFKALYKILLNREEGPRMGYLLASLDREFVTQRVKDAIEK
ncbi:MAG: lysine--tRNA ligase [Candidatus Thermoplasmatota archaeon]